MPPYPPSRPSQSVTFDRAAGFYDQTRGFPQGEDRHAARMVAQTAGLTRQHRLLEIAVGTGRVALPLAEHVRQIIGVDLAVDMMARLREKLPDYPDADIPLVRGDVMQLPIASASVDGVVMCHILHLLPEPERAIAEARRILVAGGGIIVCWNESPQSELSVVTDGWARGTGVAFQHSRRDVAPALLEQAGWHKRVENFYAWTTRVAPEAYLENYRQRVWSSLWTMPDEQLKAGIAEAEKALRAHFADPSAPIETPQRFYCAVFMPMR